LANSAVRTIFGDRLSRTFTAGRPKAAAAPAHGLPFRVPVATSSPDFPDIGARLRHAQRQSIARFRPDFEGF